MGISETIKQKQDKSAMLTRTLKGQVKMYPDKTHFIYELLQNAEDAGAKTVKFIQCSDRLELFHDGRPFTESNLASLCDSCNSDKKEDERAKGKFGIGFKSVFTICETVNLYSEPSNYKEPLKLKKKPLPHFAVKIVNFVDPDDMDNTWSLEKPYTTKFVFPYYWQNYYESQKELIKDIATKLRNLGSSVLLFLNSITEINYTISGSGSELDGQGFYMLDRKKENEQDKYYKITALGDNEDCNYILFTRPLNDSCRTVDIVFSIKENDKGIIFQRIKTNYVSVYFPTEIESKLDFIIQAPFELIPTRTNLEINSERNKDLIECLAELLKDIIFEAKTKKWISLEFLNLLPFSIPDVDFPFKSLYQYLYDVTIDMFSNEEILPTANFGEYVGKSHARLARGGIREGGIVEMFTNNELELLVGNGTRWMPIKTDTDNFTEIDNVLGKLYKFLKDEIKVKEIGNDDIPALLEKNPGFIKNFSENEKWLERFYNYLAEKKRDDLGKKQKYSQIPFIKTTKGDFVSSYKKINNDTFSNVFQKPKKALLELEDVNFVAKFIQENCSEFVDLMKIDEPDNYDYFIKELEEMYSDEKININQNLKQIERALDYLSENKSGAADVLKNYLRLSCTKTDGEETWISCGQNNVFFVNDDINGISISDYFIGTICNVYMLNENFYITKGVEKDKLRYLKNIGIKNGDNIIDKGNDIFYPNGYSSKNRGDFKKELRFLYIEKVLLSINENQNNDSSKKKSSIIFILLKSVEKHLIGEWQYGMQNPEIIPDVSDIIKLLKQKKWLYKTDGKLVTSSEITRYDLNIHRVKSHPPSPGIIRSSPYSPR